jgi:hypothetical protein
MISGYNVSLPAPERNKRSQSVDPATVSVCAARQRGAQNIGTRQLLQAGLESAALSANRRSKPFGDPIAPFSLAIKPLNHTL